MELVWILVVIVGLVALIRKLTLNARKIPQATARWNEPTGSLQSSLDQGSSELRALVTSLTSLIPLTSPSLERIKHVGRLLEAAYPQAITTLQQKQIDSILPKALEGKRASWELQVRDVSESPSVFFFDHRRLGGYWVEHRGHSPSVRIACQTFNAGVNGLKPEQSFTASGRIAKVGIQWPSLFMMIPDAVVSFARNDVTRPDALARTEPEEPGAPSGRRIPEVPAIEFSTRATDGPSYQTAPLSDYSRALYNRALEVFRLAREQGGRRGKQYKGSFTISVRSCNETAAKIVIYERGLGRENGYWPDLQDGIYVLVRSNGNAGHAIWNAELLASSPYSGRLDPRRTLGIAPKHSERFAYFRLEPEDDPRSVAELLAICGTA